MYGMMFDLDITLISLILHFRILSCKVFRDWPKVIFIIEDQSPCSQVPRSGPRMASSVISGTQSLPDVTSFSLPIAFFTLATSLPTPGLHTFHSCQVCSSSSSTFCVQLTWHILRLSQKPFYSLLSTCHQLIYLFFSLGGDLFICCPPALEHQLRESKDMLCQVHLYTEHCTRDKSGVQYIFVK